MEQEHRGEADENDGERREPGLLVAIKGNEGEDLRRQRIEVERPLSLRRATRRLKGARRPASLRAFASPSAPFSETVPASLAPVDHEGCDRLSRQALIGLFECVGKGVGGIDHRLDQV